MIFRKIGLKDGAKGFKLETRRFALFPTVCHPREVDATLAADASKPFVDAKVPDIKTASRCQSVVAEVTRRVGHARRISSGRPRRAPRVVSGRSRSRLAWKPGPRSPCWSSARRAPRAHPAPAGPRSAVGAGRSTCVLRSRRGRGGDAGLSDEAFEVKQKALRAALATVDHVGFSKASRGQWTCERR